MRHNRKWLAARAVAAVFAAWGLAATMNVAAFGSRSVHSAYQLLDTFEVYPKSNPQGQFVKMGIMLDYQGDDAIFYPQLRPNNAIPLVKVVLSMPAGDSIIKSHIKLDPPNNGKLYSRVAYWSPHSISLNPRWNASPPVWRFRELSPKAAAYWLFTVQVPAGASPCVTATATLMYKQAGQYKPIPHLQPQHGANSYIGCQTGP